MNDAVSLHFEVLSGVYCGLTGKPTLETNLIGSGLDADIIFVEQRLAPHHFRITLLGNSIEVEALAGGLCIEDNRNIAAGERVVLPLPVIIHAGAMSILWSAQDAAPAGSTARPRLSILVLTLVLLGSLGIGALSAMFSYYGTADALNAKSPGAELEFKLTNNRADDQATVAVAKDLQEEVDKAGLHNIMIGSAKGVVTAEGTVTSASVSSWQRVQQWFDHRTNGALTLVNGVVIKEEKAPSAIAVEAVWRGPLPYLIIAGEKYFVGALLDDGWTVDRIEEGRVLMSRNGRVAALPY
ncbi:hypothetical protein D3227_30925 [Mesorhizobium waimense]|uniref:Yop protein translocation protein D periplasmic domain-containing protein n=1 Tax=Mesorhizobium waimense TaxID=1300307 RepID=A0A3A5K6N1_9HYPH|nr:hypothetical protein [Mesorhizobium waimense]RJT30048.1 hypothetical protein D3227_30925 [Mesorhizobium waimense]